MTTCDRWAERDSRPRQEECRELGARSERQVCLQAVQVAREQTRRICRDRMAARAGVCYENLETIADHGFDRTVFDLSIDNPYMPLTPGMLFVYEGETEGRPERIEVRVARSTRSILGIPCVRVISRTFRDGALGAAELEWLAPDRRGNVWMFGKATYRVRRGRIVGTARGWEAGLGGALPAIVMSGAPFQPGAFYVREFLPGEPETVGLVVGVDESIWTPAGPIYGCVRTRELRTNGSAVMEERVFAPGVGLVEAVDGRSRRTLATLASRAEPWALLSSRGDPAWPAEEYDPTLVQPGGRVFLEVAESGPGLGAELGLTIPADVDLRMIRIVDLSRRIQIGITLPASGEAGEGEIIVEELDPF